MILLGKSSKFSYSNIWSLLCPCKRKLSLNYYLLQKVLFSLYIFIICSGHQCILSMNLPHCVCASFIFSCYMKSLHYIRVKNGIVLTTPPRAEKNCYIRVRNDNSMMPFVTRACTCTKNLHIDLDLDICSAHLDLRSACLLFCARRSSLKNWWRNAH